MQRSEEAANQSDQETESRDIAWWQIWQDAENEQNALIHDVHHSKQ
jgi:hypothetical protein